MPGLRPYRRKQGVVDDPGADFAEQVQGIPLLSYLHKRGLKTDGTTNVLWLEHGLGRPYRGIICTGQNMLGVILTFTTPEAVVSQGKDPGRVFGVRANGLLLVTFDVWVF